MTNNETNGIRRHVAPRNYCPENIEGKTALVTGGISGIGRATARMLLEHGARVCVYGLDESELDETLRELRELGDIFGLRADHGQPGDIARVFAEVDRHWDNHLDILVNSAGRYSRDLLGTELDTIHAVIAANIFGHIAVTREAVLRMREKGNGHIVDIGSLSAESREPRGEVYVATKAAIRAFSASLRKTINPLGIRVSLIEPGLVATTMNSADPEKQRQWIEEGKMVEALDIAEAVHYCLTQPKHCDVVTVQIRPVLQSI